MPLPRDSLVRSGVTEWLTRLLDAAGSPAAAELAAKLRPEMEHALRSAALDMLRQCGVAESGETGDIDSVKEWDVSVNEAVIAAIRTLEHKRQDG